jgi:hypothetical protein
MLLGLLHKGSTIALHDFEGLVRLVNFSLGTLDAGNVSRLPHAASATPGRYVAEMHRRLGAMGRGLVCGVCNPILEFSETELGLLAHYLLSARGSWDGLILEDGQGSPVGYVLPCRDPDEDTRFLSLLSCVDAELDAALLAALYGASPARVKLPIGYRVALGVEAFYSVPGALLTYRWLAEQGMRALRAAGKEGARALRFAAIMPFNAGDVLFAALSMRRAPGFCQALVVDRRYAAIAREAAPQLDLVEIELEPRRVDGVLDWEWVLAERIKAGLPDGYVYSYCRPSRRYDRQRVHLMDQYAFGMGDGCSSDSIRDRMPPSLALGPGDRAVLLHFDGGWPMKIYPLHWQRDLVARLQSAGYRVTVCSENDEALSAGVEQFRFTSLGHLKSRILESDILVGMDSLPAHYATHLLGAPTLCLFASTHPANSDAPAHPGYAALHQQLPCTPCGTFSRCPRFGGAECRNFTSPQAVFEAIETMWHSLYRGKS